ncbi:MAG: type IV pilin N-terminal domain-containing protein [Methanomicrobium sp.]|nr:type IV pilin N-terminal domain-containing protein [Methanomicrobium sp.]
MAAVVSGFASGLADTSAKAPQVSIGAEAHSDSYILVEHKGGDTLAIDSIDLRTFIPSGTYADMSYNINLDDTGNVTVISESSSRILQTGDSIKIKWCAAFAESSYLGSIYYMAPSVGEPLDIEVYDSSSGKVTGTTRVTVLP